MMAIAFRGLALVALFAIGGWLQACGGDGSQGATCSDGAKNGTESDVDCGGSCDPCGLGRDCISDFDCQSGNCEAGACAPTGSATCDDGVQNGYETDLDCGGTCPACSDGQGCLVDADCASNNCDNGTCGPGGGETCDDGLHNQDETDVDCGGSCPGCADGAGCAVDADCLSNLCQGGTCQAGGGPTCNDGSLNQDETDVDCGGSVCGPCADGSDCNVDGDCLSGRCMNSICQAGGGPTCNDGIRNQDETDVDCGGAVCSPCANGSLCGVDGDCLSGLCANGTCQANGDQCPDDPNKTEPGVCGCGTPDLDSDGDGAMDCVDGCPQDPLKTAEGVCGCGNPDDLDTDGDGTPDCIDGCPNDAAKTTPGLCGCSVPETDSDGDGSPDCIDGCPQDPIKTVPGACGCGVADVDSDGDGTPDCVDPCPNDPNDQCAGCNPMGWDGCPTGATEWCHPAPVDGTSSEQARVACETCFGMACELLGGDCAGDGWGPVDPGVNPADANFGFAVGCSGPEGRIWDHGTSWTTYGFWAGMPATTAAEALSFSDPAILEQTRMTLAEVSNQIWISSGGSSGGVRLAQLDGNGNLQASYSPGIDMRSVFTRARGTAPLLARGYSSNQIRVQTSPGVFGNDVVLTGGNLDSQSAVVYDHVRAMFVALTNGVIYRWNNAGTYVDSIALSGWNVDNPGESGAPQGRGVAVSHSGHYLTYYDQLLSVWDQAGQRIYTTTLVGAGTSAYYSFCYTGPTYRGWVYVLDSASGIWQRWSIGL